MTPAQATLLQRAINTLAAHYNLPLRLDVDGLVGTHTIVAGRRVAWLRGVKLGPGAATLSARAVAVILGAHRTPAELARAIYRRIHQPARGNWMPGARKLPRSGTPWQVACPSKGVLHTTEGAGDATSTLDANGDHPHFQVEQDGRITQYLPMSEGAKALVHSTWPPTNGAHAYQIEVCGFASKPDWPAKQKRAVRAVMRFIELNGGVDRAAHVPFVSGGGARLSGSSWLNLRGWCGHQHVPENDHVDPGPINITGLL